MLHSELHRWRGAVEDAVIAVKRCAADDERYLRRQSDAKQHYFVLTATSGEVLGTSAMFATTAAMERAVAAMKRDVKTAEIVK